MVSFPTELIDRITVSEDIKRLPYRDSLGIESIGIGHNLSKPISVGACDYILMDDLNDAKCQIDIALPWAAGLGDVRYWSLVELCFNMGLGVAGGSRGLLSFTHTLDALKAGQYMNAARSLLQSKWADEVGQERSERISKQIETGAWA